MRLDPPQPDERKCRDNRRDGFPSQDIHRFSIQSEDVIIQIDAKDSEEAQAAKPGFRCRDYQHRSRDVSSMMVLETEHGDYSTVRKGEEELKYLKALQGALAERLSMRGVVLTLLAGISYYGFLQPPGGFNQVEGYVLGDSPGYLCFFYFNSISFFSASAGIVKLIIFPSLEDLLSLVGLNAPNDVSSEAASGGRLLPHLQACTKFVKLKLILRWVDVYLALSLITCICSFISAGCAVLGPKLTHLQLPLLLTTALPLLTILHNEAITWIWRKPLPTTAPAIALPIVQNQI